MIFIQDTDRARMVAALDAPYVAATFSTLGGVHRPSLLITLSLDSKESWANGILQNSRYMHFHIGTDGVVEQFSRDFRIALKFRKVRVTSFSEATRKIKNYLEKLANALDARSGGSLVLAERLQNAEKLTQTRLAEERKN